MVNTMILIVSHNHAQVEDLRTQLNAHGHPTIVTASHRLAYEAYRAQPFKFALLIMEYTKNSLILEWVHQMRLISPIPIMLIARVSTPHDQLLARQAGVDDFVDRPLQPNVLLSRIQTLLERQTATAPNYHYAALTVDTAAHLIYCDRRPLNLTRREYQLLLVLIQHPEATLSRAELLILAWGADFTGPSNIIDVYVRHLRQKLALKPDKPLIHTVRGVGYSLRQS
ncbi:response regulator transcription factor [Lactiplantibacillus carotarum]|uniref:response regulator transcription factor n=1 Tax=Lactiplantibacillus carotarum TaxID=2993456 RepID=UPI00298EE8F6|nr:response regulator transcription factor [Lactiplantibacillus carotarum]